jgi:hypothetical protein
MLTNTILGFSFLASSWLIFTGADMANLNIIGGGLTTLMITGLMTFVFNTDTKQYI